MNNMVIGVTTGFTKNLKLLVLDIGSCLWKKLTLNLGLSHSVDIEIPDGIEVKMDGNANLLLVVLINEAWSILFCCWNKNT